ncbi:hypothetical protein ACWC8S_16560, partial [Streptomyces fungicidicus]
MALRSRSRTATATSGPGRAPDSDGRARHRRPAGSRVRDRTAAADELRRRAESLFDDQDDTGRAGSGRLPVAVAGIVGLLLVARRIDALALGDDTAR